MDFVNIVVAQWSSPLLVLSAHLYAAALSVVSKQMGDRSGFVALSKLRTLTRSGRPGVIVTGCSLRQGTSSAILGSNVNGPTANKSKKNRVT